MNTNTESTAAGPTSICDDCGNDVPGDEVTDCGDCGAVLCMNCGEAHSCEEPEETAEGPPA